jgi:hypothetical protein
MEKLPLAVVLHPEAVEYLPLAVVTTPDEVE